MTTHTRTVLQSWTRGDCPFGFHWSTLFPSLHWRTVMDTQVRLEVEAEGPVTVMGRSHGRTVAVGVLPRSGCLDLTLEEDWLWVETPGHIQSVKWSAPLAVTLPRITAIVPTIGRIAETRAQITNFCASELVDLVLVIDQRGGISCDETVAALTHANPGRIRIIEQDNFGGSGGYARGMIEACAHPERAILLSDDDAYLDPQSLRRMAIHQALAQAQGINEIVGTPVLDAGDPTRLQICAEYVRAQDFMWTKADSLFEARSTETDPDGLADALNLVHTPNYTGWWGCLLPPGTPLTLGGPLPFFLKWDDAEYGLRAVDNGYAITVLPGTGVTHPRWDTPRTLWSWSGVVSQRNRLALGAARGASLGILASSFAHQIKHVLSLQYDVAESWNAAGNAVADGASWLGTDLLHTRQWAHNIWTRAHEVTAHKALEYDPATPRAIAQNWRAARSSNALSALALLMRPHVLVRQVREVDTQNYAWWDSLGAQAVRLTDSSCPVLLIDPPRARRILASSISTHAKLAARWKKLHGEYAHRARIGARLSTWSSILGVPCPTTSPDQCEQCSRSGKAGQ